MSEQLRLCEANVTQYLRGQGFLRPGERVELEPAGDGNINWVRRVRIFPSGRSFVLKQARPSLERFPEYSVTTERIVFEARYYEIARKEDREGLLPTVLAFDPRERVLILEDLGAVERLDQALSRGDDTHNSARALGFFLARVHAATQGEPGLVERFANDDMCRLHGDHIFFLPFRENSFPLSPRLRARAQELWKDAELVSCADAAYARYRHVKSALVHGDVQAGNVLLASSGPKLLDAEIAHVGDPAFDVGTLLAHLCVNSLASRRSSRGLVRAAWSAYADAAAPQGVRFEEVARYAGLELLRRTLGAARLKAVEQDEAGLAVLETAVRWIRRPPPSLEALASVA